MCVSINLFACRATLREVTEAPLRHNAAMDGVNLEFVAERLRAAGARFAFLHGSRGDGVARPDSDVDIAAWFGRRDVDASAVAAELPGAVDLLVLDTAPLELAGRVAQAGRLLFEVDPEARVNWQATTRRVYLDEKPRIERARADFVRAHRRG